LDLKKNSEFLFFFDLTLGCSVLTDRDPLGSFFPLLFSRLSSQLLDFLSHRVLRTHSDAGQHPYHGGRQPHMALRARRTALDDPMELVEQYGVKQAGLQQDRCQLAHQGCGGAIDIIQA